MVRAVRNFFGQDQSWKLGRNQRDTVDNFYLWIDGVGGYLVCPRSVVRVGHLEAPGVDIALAGDLAECHATLLREDDLYTLEARGPVRVDGHPVERTVLPERCLLELGSGVRLQFIRPHPWSATARLEFVSSHRTVPASDGILLFARTLVLGPEEISHIVCPVWKGNVIVYRVNETLRCKASGLFTVDGKVVRGEAVLTPHSRVEGTGWRMQFEPVSAR